MRPTRWLSTWHKVCKGSIFYFARDGSDPVIVAHRAEGGRAAFVRDNAVVLAEGDRETVLIDLDARAPDARRQDRLSGRERPRRRRRGRGAGDRRTTTIRAGLQAFDERHGCRPRAGSTSWK